MRKKQYKKNVKKAANKKFAKKVWSAVNSKAEVKMWNREQGFSNVSSAGATTYNLLSGLLPGTGTSSRIGNKIFLKNLRLAVEFQNSDFTGTNICNSGYGMRVIVFRGKYDHSSTNYPTSEIFESNSGGTPATQYINARLDRNQITPLFDKVMTIPGNNYVSQVCKQFRTFWIKINKTYNFREDDSFGATSNLYVAFVSGAGPSEGVCQTMSASLTYTDV